MLKRLLFILLLIAYQSAYSQSNVFANDEELSKLLKDNLINALDNNDFVPFEKFREQLNSLSYSKINISNNKNIFSSKIELYKEGKKSTLVIGKLFDTEKNGSNLVYTATATLISSDGICITNHHVFEKMSGGYTEKLIGVMDFEGNFYKITEVLTSNEKDDLVIFKVDTQGKHLQAFNLGELPEIGSNVHVIGHPKNNYYTYSTGVVSRLYFYAAEKSDRISITADFALGSSGGPILNDNGQLIGMVAATISIPNASAPQMVIKEIIPISSIKKLIDKINSI